LPDPNLITLLISRQTTKSFYILAQNIVNRQAILQCERVIPLGAIRYVSTSTLKDDWFSLGVASQQEADPLLSCIFKTELFTHMKNAMPGGLNLKIADS
jgi:myosin I